MLNRRLDTVSGIKQHLETRLLEWRWNKLRALGMRIGSGVLLPETTWIDVSHCNHFSIGDICGFGPQYLILAHDAQTDEFIDAARVGRVIIHPSSHIGARSVSCRVWSPGPAPSSGRIPSSPNRFRRTPSVPGIRRRSFAPCRSTSTSTQRR